MRRQMPDGTYRERGPAIGRSGEDRHEVHLGPPVARPRFTVLAMTAPFRPRQGRAQ